jgi:hypothetical protein
MRRVFVSMGEVVIHRQLILEIRKKILIRLNFMYFQTASSGLYLQTAASCAYLQTASLGRYLQVAFLVGQIPNEHNRLTRKVVMDLRGIQILNAQRSRIDGLGCCSGVTSDTTNQAIQEVVKLENLVRSSCDVRSLWN